MTDINVPSHVKNEELQRWVVEMFNLCKPDSVYWCDGSQEEYDRLCAGDGRCAARLSS